jgi:hypothetical protein
MNKEDFTKRLQKAFALSDRYIKDATVDTFYEKLGHFDYIDFCDALNHLEDNGLQVTFYSIRERIKEKLAKKNKKPERKNNEYIFIEECETRNCKECKYPVDAICKVIAKETMNYLPMLLDNKTFQVTIDKLDKMFEGAGFKTNHEKCKSVFIDEDGKQDFIY